MIDGLFDSSVLRPSDANSIHSMQKLQKHQLNEEEPKRPDDLKASCETDCNVKQNGIMWVALGALKY